jgi:hypothetical protein
MAQGKGVRTGAARDEAPARARREPAAGTLLESVPALLSLRFAVAEARVSGWHGRGYVRYVDLGLSLANFELPCSYVYCQGGGYDLTAQVLAGLGLRRASFEGKQACVGRCGAVGCSRHVSFEARATYRPPPGATDEGAPPDPVPPRAVPGWLW